MRKTRIKNMAALLCAAVITAPLFCACAGGGTDPGGHEITEAQDTSEPRKWDDKRSVSLHGKSYALSGVNEAQYGEGVYYFSREWGVSAPEGTGDYIDCAVCAGMVCEITRGEPAVIPENGFVMRFAGVMPEDGPEPGEAARCSFDSHPYLPSGYVRCGDICVGAEYRNIVRIDDDAGFIFDGGWYASTTFGNPYGTEVAVDADGNVAEINPAGSEKAGKTAIPEGGFVIAAGQGSATEKLLLKFNVGDKAEYLPGNNIFTAAKFGLNDKDPASRPDFAAVVTYTYGKNKKTPEGSWITEIAVNGDGRVEAVYPYCQGGNTVPRDGFIVSGSGKYTEILSRRVSAGDIAVQNGPRGISFINNSQSVYDKCVKRLEAAKSVCSLAEEKLYYVDYEKAEEYIDALQSVLLPGGKKPAAGQALYESITRALELLEKCETELIPSVPAGDRAAWVTVGEDDGEGRPYLHYSDDGSVERAVKYAKSLNINTLIIDDAASGYTVYRSEVPGLLPHPALGGFDVLASFQKFCSAEGMRLIVMMSSLAAVNAGREYPENHYINLYSDKIMKTNRGNTVDAYGVTALDPSYPEVLAFRLAEAKEIAEKYPDIYGIQLDYIRYPLPLYYQAHNYEDFGYDSPASQKFGSLYGADPKNLKTDDPLWDEWCAVRRGVITDTARAYSEELRAVKPDINISFTCFANENDRHIYVMQEPEIWAEEGIADAIYPMIYGDTTEYQSRCAAEYAGMEEHAAVVLGVGSYVRATRESMAEQLYMPFDMGYEGSSNFTLRYISVCGYNDTVKKAFRTPAVPSGSGEATAKAVCDMIVFRCGTLKYLYPDEKGLDEYAAKIKKASASKAGLDGVTEILASVEMTDGKLAAALLREAEYADRLLKRK